MLAPHRPVNPLIAVLFRSNHLKIPYARGTVTVQGLSLIWLTSSLGSSTCPEHVIRYLWRNISYRQHNNTNPVTKEPLKPEDLIGLNYSRKTTGEYHDPISFKPFSEHSHIVAIATTGNVYLAESIKGGKDLLDDVKFKKYAHGHVLCGSDRQVPSQRGCHYLTEPTWNATSIYSVNVNENRSSADQRQTDDQTKTRGCKYC